MMLEWIQLNAIRLKYTTNDEQKRNNSTKRIHTQIEVNDWMNEWIN